MYWRSFLILILLPCCVQAVQIIEGKDEHISLLELYTSEGCSSCPPAERWITKLKDDSRLWQQVVPIAFHVTYWDYLGWKDPFAHPNYTARQYRYSRSGLTRSVYTPGFLLNGQEWRNFFTNKKMRFGNNKHPGRLMLEVDVAGGTLQAQFLPKKLQLKEDQQYLLNVAILGFGIENSVPKGENAGRVLQHNFTVLGLTQTTMTVTDEEDIGSGLMAQAQLMGLERPAAQYGIGAWLTQKGDLRVLQAVGDYLVTE